MKYIVRDLATASVDEAWLRGSHEIHAADEVTTLDDACPTCARLLESAPDAYLPAA